MITTPWTWGLGPLAALGFLLCSSTPALLLSPAQCQPMEEEPARIVAVADLHGDWDNAMRVLRLSNVVDAEGHWSAGKALLVQTGDIVDRGPNSTALLNFFQGLQAEAAAAGGEVKLLLGNHELMILQGDLRYVAHEEVAALGGRDRWAAHYTPEAPVGAALRSGRIAAHVAGEGPCRTLFVHAGLLPEHIESDPENGVANMNAAVRARLQQGPRVDRRSHWWGERGPFWHRGLVMDHELKACPLVARTLAAVGAEQMVVGHTVQRRGRVAARCGGTLHMIDVGISAAYGGHRAAWECSTLPGDRNSGIPHAVYEQGVTEPLALLDSDRSGGGSGGAQVPRGAGGVGVPMEQASVWQVTLVGLAGMWLLRRLLGRCARGQCPEKSV